MHWSHRSDDMTSLMLKTAAPLPPFDYGPPFAKLPSYWKLGLISGSQSYFPYVKAKPVYYAPCTSTVQLLGPSTVRGTSSAIGHPVQLTTLSLETCLFNLPFSTKSWSV